MKKNHQTNETDENKEKEDILEETTPEDALKEDSQTSELEAENQKLKDELLRALAETENVKKRCAIEIEKTNKYAVSAFAKDLLSVADNLDRALSLETSESKNALREGIELTKKELLHVFEKFGITPMESLDNPFDPNFHRVIQEVPDPSKPAGTVIAELQKGYMINGRILREAMVVVSKS